MNEVVSDGNAGQPASRGEQEGGTINMVGGAQGAASWIQVWHLSSLGGQVHTWILIPPGWHAIGLHAMDYSRQPPMAGGGSPSGDRQAEGLTRGARWCPS